RTSSAMRLKNSAPAPQNARKSPLTGAVKDVVSTKNSPASGCCLRDLPNSAGRHSGRLRAQLAASLGVGWQPTCQGFLFPFLPSVYTSLRRPTPQQHAHNGPGTRAIEVETASYVAALTREVLPAHCRVRTQARQIWTRCAIRQPRSNYVSAHQTTRTTRR